MTRYKGKRYDRMPFYAGPTTYKYCSLFIALTGVVRLQRPMTFTKAQNKSRHTTVI